MSMRFSVSKVQQSPVAPSSSRSFVLPLLALSLAFLHPTSNGRNTRLPETSRAGSTRRENIVFGDVQSSMEKHDVLGTEYINGEVHIHCQVQRRMEVEENKLAWALGNQRQTRRFSASAVLQLQTETAAPSGQTLHMGWS